MGRIEIEVKGLFATPVAAVMLPDAAARNAELAQAILRRREATPYTMTGTRVNRPKATTFAGSVMVSV